MAESDLIQRIESLERRLEAAEATLAIQRLKARYAELVDSRYTAAGPRTAPEIASIADAIVALFTEDAVWDGGERLGLHRGRAAIRQRFLEPTLHFTLHYFVMPAIEVEGDRASARWQILAPIRFGDGRAGWMSGSEDDVYRRDAQGDWRHERMRLQVNFLVPYERGWALPSTGAPRAGSA